MTGKSPIWSLILPSILSCKKIFLFSSDPNHNPAQTRREIAKVCPIAVIASSASAFGRPAWTKRWRPLARHNGRYSGAALSPRAPENFEANDAITIKIAISPTTSVQMALISGFTPSRTSE